MAESVMNDGTYMRQYPYGRQAAHIIGYTGTGSAGIEAAENFSLLGMNNEVAQRASSIFGQNDKILSGDNIRLTIDMDIQKLAFNLLGDNIGAAVVIDPTTGSIIAMASSPGFDPNSVNRDWDKLSTDENSPMLNRATQGLYPPGSTFKIVTALAAMRSFDDVDSFSFDCGGEIQLGNKIIHCFNSKVHGILSIDSGMACSCNCLFAQIGDIVGAGRLRETADSLHINSHIDFNLPLSDSIMSLNSSSNSSELAETSIGQGRTLVTPMYMGMLISAIANGGTMMQPYMVESVTDGEGNVKATTVPKILDRVMTADEADRIAKMLTEVVNSGTGSAASLRGYQAAGKTGTAENSKEYDHSWFVGYASTDKPQVAVAIILENVSGSQRAAPIGGKLMQAVLDKKNPQSSSSSESYIPKAELEQNNDEDVINSETGIIEDAEIRDDGYVIGSDQMENIEENGDNNSNENTPGNGNLSVPGEFEDMYGNELSLVNK
ncbi:penicillin-binding protein A [Clostridiales bacterium]|nr:penicillin-binding protein A [Clostridiales bacterium]